MYNLNLEEFMNELIINVTDRLGDSVRINKTEILKNNSVRYHGLVLSREGNNISPTIYVDELYKNYIRGASMDDLAVEIVNVYCKHSEKVNFVNIEYENWTRFECVKDNIFMKMVNYERNRELLMHHPHIRFLDLAITFHIKVDGVDESQGSVRVNDELLRHWGITIEELYEVGEYNTQRLYPYVVKPMEDMINELLSKDSYNNCEYNETNEQMCGIVDRECSGPEMYVLTNTCGINGAISITNDDFVEEFARNYGEKFVVLPSSIHEVICVVNVDEEDYEHLSTMVKEVNITQIMPEEILSDNIYIYNQELGELECYE